MQPHIGTNILICSQFDLHEKWYLYNFSLIHIVHIRLPVMRLLNLGFNCLMGLLNRGKYVHYVDYIGLN